MTDRKVEIDFEKLSVNNKEDCKHWVGLLDTAVRYHRDMVEMFEGEEDEDLYWNSKGRTYICKP